MPHRGPGVGSWAGYRKAVSLAVCDRQSVHPLRCRQVRPRNSTASALHCSTAQQSTAQQPSPAPATLSHHQRIISRRARTRAPRPRCTRGSSNLRSRRIRPSCSCTCLCSMHRTSSRRAGGCGRSRCCWPYGLGGQRRTELAWVG